MSFLKKEPNPLPGADHRRKIKVAGCQVNGFWRKFKMVDEESQWTDLNVSCEEDNSTILLAHYIFWF